MPVPSQYQRQVQWTMGVTGLRVAWVVAFAPWGAEHAASGADPALHPRTAHGRRTHVISDHDMGNDVRVITAAVEVGLLQITQLPFIPEEFDRLFKRASAFFHRILCPLVVMSDAGGLDATNFPVAYAAVRSAAEKAEAEQRAREAAADAAQEQRYGGGAGPLQPAANQRGLQPWY